MGALLLLSAYFTWTMVTGEIKKPIHSYYLFLKLKESLTLMVYIKIVFKLRDTNISLN